MDIKNNIKWEKELNTKSVYNFVKKIRVIAFVGYSENPLKDYYI